MKQHVNMTGASRPGRIIAGTLLGVSLLGLASFTACSSDDSINAEPPTPSAQTPPANEIRYNVVADNASRATKVYNSNTLPTQFHVSAWVVDSIDKGNREYIRWDLIQDRNPKGLHDWVDQSGLRYWPAEGAQLNFFATTADEGGFTDAKNAKYQIPCTVAGNSARQADLLYATAYGQRRSVSGAKGQAAQTVNLAFHHALSQVVFTAQCSNPHIQVYIGNITVGGIAGTGTLSMSATDPSQAAAWTIPANYTPGQYTSAVADDGAVTVGQSVTNVSAGSAQGDLALMLLPQTVAAADPSAPNPWTSGKAYLKVDCLIYNVAKGNASGTTDVYDTLVFGKDNGTMTDYESLYIPLGVNWTMGKRYVYNLVFGNGNGGYLQDGTAALIPVKYAVSVDNWADGGTSSFTEPTL